MALNNQIFLLLLIGLATAGMLSSPRKRNSSDESFPRERRSILSPSRVSHPEGHAHQLRVLHFNDGYDFEKTPAFAHEFMRRNTENTLRIFSGDLFNPSVASVFHKGEQFSNFLDRIQCQYAVIGNHDVDFGEDWFLRLTANHSIKWLLANFKHNNHHGRNLGFALEYEITEVNGLKVGVFGLIDDSWIRSCSLKVQEFEYEPAMSTARRVSKILKDEGCDLILAVTHMENSTDEAILNDDSNYVDIILGGHVHIYYVRKIKQKLLLKSGCDFEHFSDLKLELSDRPLGSSKLTAAIGKEFAYLMRQGVNEDQYDEFNFSLDRGSNRYVNVEISKVRVDLNGPKDQSLELSNQAILGPLAQSFSRPIFKIDGELDIRSEMVRTNESYIADFMTDIIRVATEADVTIMNGGSFRSETLYQSGEILYFKDAIKLLPYQDTVVTLKVPGSTLLQLMEQGLQSYPEEVGSFLCISGARLRFDPQKEPMHRIIEGEYEVNGLPLDVSKTYLVSTSAYLATPRDGYTKFKGLERVNKTNEAQTPLDILKTFWELIDSSKTLEEFEVFKGNFPDMTLADLDRLGKVKAPKVYYYLTQDLISHERNLERLLSKMHAKAMKRLKMFSLAHKIEQFQDTQIFVLRTEIDGRLQPKMEFDL